MRAGMRILLAVLGLFPLLAPYELLLEVEWQHYLNPFFFIAVLISVGAIALSALLVFAAAAGLSSQLAFDKRTGTLRYHFEAPVIRRRKSEYLLSDINSIEVGMRDWSDSSPTYHLKVIVSDGTTFESGAAWDRSEIELIRGRVQQFLAGSACPNGGLLAR